MPAATLLLLAYAHTPGDVCHFWNKDGCFPPPAVSAWPQPTSMSVGEGGLSIGVSRLRFECEAGAKNATSTGTAACDDVLTAALKRYANIIAGTAAEAGRSVPTPIGLTAAAAPDVASGSIFVKQPCFAATAPEPGTASAVTAPRRPPAVQSRLASAERVADDRSSSPEQTQTPGPDVAAAPLTALSTTSTDAAGPPPASRGRAATTRRR